MKAGKRVLVVYYSLSGNTARVAEDLAKRLGAECERLVDPRIRRGPLGYWRAVLDSIRERSAELTGLGKHPGDYALTIVGTPIWAGRITPAARAYLRMNRGKFNDVAFFTTSGSTAAEEVVPAMESLADRQASAFTGFTAADLKPGELAGYEQKIVPFLDALQNGRALPTTGEPVHAPA